MHTTGNNRRSPATGPAKVSRIFLGCDLDVNDLTTFIRLNLDATSAHPNPDVLHTVRIGDTTAFDFYFARGKQDAKISQVSGEPLVIFRGSPGSDTGSYTLQRNGVLITMRNLTTPCADE
ncbi:hypothetical protein [Bifidobacterium thermacidophilum]|uniref:hypothetical protein n=1 Tax=Bifidobacterium thermacidophilum TaxID=246618 RepID=UPI0026F1C1FF|nr:hypothetical protein [Bifidobacterium thermacidophilum]